jgi:hypothetical protein
VIDLKSKPFMPEDAGKIYFYLNAVDDLQPILPTIEQTEREIAGSIEYSDDTNTGQMLKELQLEYGMRRAGYETVVRNRVGFWRWSVG